MKKLLLPAIIILSALQARSQQDQGGIGDEYFHYETADRLVVRQFLIGSQTVDNTKANDRLAGKGLTFYVIGDKRKDDTFGEYYLVRFYEITKESAVQTGDNTIINSNNTKNDAANYWCISAGDFGSPTKVKRRYGTWKYNPKLVIGQLTIPFKIRPANGNLSADYTGDFTIGTSIGIGFRISHYKKNYINFSLAGGITSVSVDSLTTQGFVTQTTKWSALSSGFAVTFDFNGFQIGGVAGFDFVSGNPGKQWVYNNNLWYSVGIGYQFIKPKE